MRTARSYVHHLRHASEGTTNNAEQAREGVEHDVPLTGFELQKESVTIKVPTEEVPIVTHTEGKLNDEEGWASEDSTGSTIASSSVVPGRKKRVRSSKGKAVVKPVGAGLNKKGRRRSSVNEQGRSSPHPSSDTTPALSPVANEPERAQGVPEDVDQRGRSARPERRSSGLSARPSVQHRRLESLRLAQHTRDASPTRSIRFADEPRSGTNTPRNSMLQNETSSPISQVDDSAVDEDESAKGRVTFELAAKE